VRRVCSSGRTSTRSHRSVVGSPIPDKPKGQSPSLNDVERSRRCRPRSVRGRHSVSQWHVRYRSRIASDSLSWKLRPMPSFPSNRFPTAVPIVGTNHGPVAGRRLRRPPATDDGSGRRRETLGSNSIPQCRPGGTEVRPKPRPVRRCRHHRCIRSQHQDHTSGRSAIVPKPRAGVGPTASGDTSVPGIEGSSWMGRTLSWRKGAGSQEICVAESQEIDEFGALLRGDRYLLISVVSMRLASC